MLVTKSEFAKKLGYKDYSTISGLLKRGTIVADADGLIDLDNKKNKKWIKARMAKLAKDAEQKENPEKSETPEKQINNQMHSEISALNKNLLEQKFIEQQNRAEFSRIRLSEKKKELFDKDAVREYAREYNASFVKNMLQLPSIYAHDVRDIFKTDKNSIETFIEFFTGKIHSEYENLNKREQKISDKCFKQ